MWCDSDPFTLYLTLFAYSWINNKTLGWLHLGMLVCIPWCNFFCNLVMFHLLLPCICYLVICQFMHFHFWINCISNCEDSWSDATNLHKTIFSTYFFFQSAGMYCTTVSFYQTRFPDIECLTGQVFTLMLIKKFPDKMEEACFF